MLLSRVRGDAFTSPFLLLVTTNDHSPRCRVRCRTSTVLPQSIFHSTLRRFRGRGDSEAFVLNYFARQVPS